MRYRGFIGFGSINLDFYSLPGIGNLPRPVELNLDGPILFQEFKYRWPVTSFFVGARQLYRKVETRFESAPDASILLPAAADWLGSDVDYDSVNLTALNYWNVGANFTLGLRLQLDGIDADSDERLPVYVPPYVNLREPGSADHVHNYGTGFRYLVARRYGHALRDPRDLR